MMIQLIKLNRGVKVMTKEMKRMNRTLTKLENHNHHLVGLNEVGTQAMEAAVAGARVVYDNKFDIWAREYKEDCHATSESETSECDEEDQWRSSDEDAKGDGDNRSDPEEKSM